MIDFELSDGLRGMQQLTHQAAEMAMRPIAREYDECEHEKPWDFLNMMWAVSHSNPIGGTGDRKAKEGPSERNLGMCVSIEELSWGDAGLYLSIPNAGLGGAAVAAAGTPEQKARFLKRFTEGGKPKWAAMAITEPSCGSDSSAIQTTAVRDREHWGPRGARLRAGDARAARRPDPLRTAVAQAHRPRARLHGHGGAAPGRAAAHLACRLDDGQRDAQQPRGVDGKGEGGSRRDAGDAEGG